MEISGIPRLETLGIEPGTITKGVLSQGQGQTYTGTIDLQDQLRGIWLKNLHRNKYMYNPSCLTKPPPPQVFLEISKTCISMAIRLFYFYTLSLE